MKKVAIPWTSENRYPWQGLHNSSGKAHLAGQNLFYYLHKFRSVFYNFSFYRNENSKQKLIYKHPIKIKLHSFMILVQMSLKCHCFS